jgi:hypothetical protein
MNTPQVIWIVLSSLAVFLSFIKHGEDRGKFSFWWSLVSVGLEAWILYAGGFFK